MLQDNTKSKEIKQASFSARVNWHSNMEEKSSCDTLEVVTEPTCEVFILHNTQSSVFSS